MALTRLAVAWLAVTACLLIWELLVSRLGSARGNGRLRRARVFLVEALLLTMLGALLFGSLGAWAWWLVFGLVVCIAAYIFFLIRTERRSNIPMTAAAVEGMEE